MGDVISLLRKKYQALSPALTERSRRLWAGIEADAIGRGGVAWVAKATGLAISTVRKGRDEARRGGAPPDLVRDRRRGAGRLATEVKDPGLVAALEALVSPATRGDPESPLRWVSKSLRTLAAELRRAKHRASIGTLSRILRGRGYSLQANKKSKEGDSHPDRDAQFNFINEKTKDFLARGLPVISVDAKKKERVAPLANPGREWEPRGKPVEVSSHDFFEVDGPTATPYGIYDLGKNVGFVNVGIDRNTPSFAAHSVEKWWLKMGSRLYPDATALFITADSGGSNSAKSRIWKLGLQTLADRTGLTIHMSHFPPGTSKWNKIEHRLFSFITLNWRGRPLATYETIISLIAATTTARGLKVQAELDQHNYPLGVRISKEAVDALALARATFHGEWNYTLNPRTPEQLAAAATPRTARHIVSKAARRERWNKLFGEQLRSGLSGAEFCRQRGIKYFSFTTARRRLVGKIRKLRRDEN